MSWRERFEARGSALCIGLDPVAGRLPAGLGLFEFCAEVMSGLGLTDKVDPECCRVFSANASAESQAAERTK